MRAASPALRSKYSHHRPTLLVSATAKAAISVLVMWARPDSVTPMTRIDSPSAMSTNPWHRSAKCPPSIVHSCVVERPSPGV